MKKFIAKIVGIATAFAMIVGVGVAVANNKEAEKVEAATFSGTFNKFSGTITEGDYVVTSTTYTLGNTISSNRLTNGRTNLTDGASSIIDPDVKEVWHISPDGDYWTLYNEAVSKYAAGNGTKNNSSLIDSITDYARWTVTGTSTYQFENLGRANGGSNTGNKWLRNNTTSGWAPYADATGGALTLYKKVLTAASINGASSVNVGTQWSPNNITEDVSGNTVTGATYAFAASDGATISTSNTSTGTFIASAPGTVTVSATKTGFAIANKVVSVVSALAETISVDGTNVLYVGDEDLELTATPSNFSPASYTWNSTDTSVATISGTGATGTLHALAKGTTTITASATGSSGLVTSNSFVVTVKKFSISLSESSISMKTSSSRIINVTPEDENGTVVVTAASANASAATASVEGTTITINTGVVEGIPTTITISAKDNNGASGFHTAESQTINLMIGNLYIESTKVTSLPGSDTKVFLANGDKSSWVGEPNGSNKFPEETEKNDAAIFILSSTGTLKYFDQSTEEVGNYLYNTNASKADVTYSENSAQWNSGMSNENYPGLLQLSGGRFLLFNGGLAKAYASSNLESNVDNIIYAYLAVAQSPSLASSDSTISIATSKAKTVDITLAYFNPLPTLEYNIQSGASSISSVALGEISNLNKATLTITASSTTGEAVVRVRDAANPSTYYVDIAVTVEADAKPEVEALNTRASLSYHYAEDGLGGFNYTNVGIRFKATVSTSLWNRLDRQYGIEGYVVLLYWTDEIEDDDVKDWYEYGAESGPVRKFYNAIPDDAEHPNQTGDNYGWTLYWDLNENPVSLERLTRTYVVASFIKTTSGLVFFNQVKASAKSLAHDMVESGAYDGQSCYDSLDYLAGLTA